MRVGTTLSMFLLVAGPATAQLGGSPYSGPLDSLCSTWTIRELREHAGDPKVVSWAPLDTNLSRTRLHALTEGVPAFQDGAVAEAILLFGGPRRHDTELLLGLAAPWMPLVEDELAEASLPTGLKYLPLALSAMNMRATSTCGEAGPWMLSYPVAVRYGLTVNDTIDERHDMVRATAAAVRYLKHLRARHGEEEALLAFLCGPANLTRAKGRSGGATALAELYPHVEAGERDRVPAFMALRYLARYADDLGIRPVDIPPPATDTLRTGASVRTDALTRLLGIEARAFAELNPAIVGRHLPAHALLRVPEGMATRYAPMADSIARVSLPAPDTAGTAPVVMDHTVLAGEHLGGIAAEYGVSVAELMEWNGLKSDLVREGAVLRVRVSAPVAEALESDRAAPANSPAPAGAVRTSGAARPAPAPATKARVYTVRPGDTLSGIAQRFPGVSARDIMRHNGIGEMIRAGQKLRIPPPR